VLYFGKIAGNLRIAHDQVSAPRDQRNLESGKALLESGAVIPVREVVIMPDKIKIAPCLWFNKNAEEAAKFYAATFQDSRVLAVHKAPADYPAVRPATC
jgi:hypothetical protein